MRLIKFLVIVFFFISCNSKNKNVNEINIYSQRHYKVDEIQYKNFEELTGIKVNVTKANADELIQRMKNEGENSPADLFITVDVGKLWQGSDMNLFQKIFRSHPWSILFQGVLFVWIRMATLMELILIALKDSPCLFQIHYQMLLARACLHNISRKRGSCSKISIHLNN